MRIAIVNDVPMAIEAMRRVILSSRKYQIAWTAADGSQALERCRRDRPDLILMDLIMPGIDGVEAIRRIMSQCPCAILVVTGSVTGNCARVFEAMGAGAHMWSRTDLKPKDVDLAQLYDGFTVLSLYWLEGLQFCGKGESGAYVDGGERISLTGELPLATSGGQLSAGRLHGFGHLYEACLQLRGQAGQRQVAGAKVAAVSAGAGPLASCLLLRTDG